MQLQGKQFTTVVGNHEITFETGKLAGQAGGAVTARVGDAVIFAAATMSNNIREGIDFLPLSVEYEEKMYAGGRIPGGFFRSWTQASGVFPRFWRHQYPVHSAYGSTRQPWFYCGVT